MRVCWVPIHTIFHRSTHLEPITFFALVGRRKNAHNGIGHRRCTWIYNATRRGYNRFEIVNNKRLSQMTKSRNRGHHGRAKREIAIFEIKSNKSHHYIWDRKWTTIRFKNKPDIGCLVSILGTSTMSYSSSMTMPTILYTTVEDFVMVTTWGCWRGRNSDEREKRKEK